MCFLGQKGEFKYPTTKQPMGSEPVVMYNLLGTLHFIERHLGDQQVKL